jgi:hypothetical protein
MPSPTGPSKANYIWRRASNSPSRRINVALVSACLNVFARVASAQPFLPPAGEGNVTVTYQAAFTRGQLNDSGQESSPGSTYAHSLIWLVEFGLSDRLAVHASLPFMMVRYEGPLPHRSGIKGQPSDLDDGTYHGSFQDYYFGARFNVVQSPRFTVTPFAEAIVPSHHYESLAQSAVGRDLRALVVGAAIGGFADALLPGLFFQTRLSYAVVQEVLDIRANRSGVDSAMGYFVTPRFAIQFVETFQITHDGIDWVGNRPGPPPRATMALHSGAPFTPDHRRNHDRLIRTNVLNLGGGLTFALTDSLAILATATTMAWGQNVQRPRSVTVGASWHFQTRRAASRPSPQLTHRVPHFR